MSASQALGGQSRCGRVIGPSLDKIIKNAAWRKHSAVVAACKAALDKLETIDASDGPVDLAAPLVGLSLADANFVLHPLVLALDAAYGKIAEPALECAFKLFSFNLIHAEIVDSGDPSSVTAPLRLIHGACKSGGIGDEAVELAVLRVLLAAVRSPSVLIRGDCLVHIVKTCYNVYLGGQNGTNQICAKSVLAQIMVIAFARVEADAMDVTFKTVSVSELLEFTDKNLNEGSSIHFCQNFVSEVVDANDGATENNNLELSISSESQNGDAALKDDEKVQVSEGESNGVKSAPVGSKIREDGYMLFKNLCKLSMKFSSQEQTDDQILLRGKILSLELLKVIMDVGGPIWRSDERFLSAIKQFLCLSLLKNSALSVMAIFQLQCCIFMSLLTKYRPGLKAEIGIFFPMLILRVLENILQPSFLQKMTVLNLLEKISQDPQLIIDVFVNYDCDVDSPNIFERIVNGLHKTALGPPAGSATTLSPAQDVTFRFESVKCLVRIIMSMGTWMDQQLKIGYLNHHSRKVSEADLSFDSFSIPSGEDGTVLDYDETNSELSDAATLEQRRTYKMELQKGVMLFNRKPSKGIEFLISTNKVGSSPEEVAAFLKNTAIGLSETTIGDYLGERDDFPLKVMHAYVDSFNFIGMDFGEAIRFFLRGFRLPGEAQKIDRIMEKFAERYCKCHPNSFTSADTAYVLAYSVIMLNTDAHNNMVKDKMSKADFIRNNRGIDDGKDLPEEFLSNLYDHIVRHEIKMSSDSSAQQSKQANSLNKLLGLDGILNLVTGKQSEEKALGANGLLIRHIQEQFKAKSGKTESIYHSVTDLAILRFMVEVCWAPMLAAFSVTLDQSDDKLATAQCLQGFRFAVHVTAVMGMQTQRDAFMTSVAKFTYLHNAADMKQKNVDAVKAIIAIAIEDGNHLQEAWEHILTCLSRIEHLQLLGEGAPTDASFFTAANGDTDERALKAAGFSSYKKKGTIQNSAVMAVVRGGSYDSTSTGVNASGLVSPEQINNFISNLNLLDQIGNFELNHVFAHSQRLNSDGIVAFVRALCKVSMAELQSPTDPRVFSLTKLVEIAHYNMNRIRLVWTRIWNVLSDFFVSVGLSENLSVAIFVMDSLRQLAMKFLEREELANYNFQNEFLRPFVIIMQKSGSAEIRELIVRCISQMVLTRVNHVKSGWKSVFLIFTAAAADERKNIVQLAFETIEKIVREYFPYITETETTTFTDCVRCLLAFTTSRFNSDVSLNAIAFLRFCAVKLAEDGLASKDKIKDVASAVTMVSEIASYKKITNDKYDNASYWVPLLAGLAKLTSDSRKAIRKSSLEVLFNILKDHGHLFSTQFWEAIYKSILFPIFISASDKKEGNTNTNTNTNTNDEEESSPSASPPPPQAEGSSTWDSETSSIAAKLLVGLTVTFFPLVRSQLSGVVSVLTGFIKSPVQGTASTGVAAMVRLGDDLGKRLGDEEWREIYTGLKEAAETSVPGLLKLLGLMENIDFINSEVDHYSSDQGGLIADEIEDDNLQTAAYVISRMKSHIAVQLLILQVVTDLYTSHPKSLSEHNISILLSMLSSICSHSNRLNSNKMLQKKLQRACSILDLSEPPLVHFENETHQNHLTFLKTLLLTSSASPKHHHTEKEDFESQLITVCTDIIQIYLNCIIGGGGGSPQSPSVHRVMHWVLPLGSAVKEELAARTTLIVAALEVVSGFDRGSFRRHAGRVFPLLVELVRSEHSSGEVQEVITNIFQSCIGPLIMEEES